MAGREHETPAGGGHGRLRASDADREQVIDVIKAAFVDGRVTKDEFDARVSQTLLSRTYAELAVVTADLPAWLARPGRPGRPGRPVRIAPSRPAPARDLAPAGANITPGDRVVMGTATLAVLALVAALFTGNPVAGMLMLVSVGSAVGTLYLIASLSLCPSTGATGRGGRRRPC
ncbi:MAG: DUF1707 SHOCT-like domain-containing protein [Streptosporangiaceae bacterium]